MWISNEFRSDTDVRAASVKLAAPLHQSKPKAHVRSGPLNGKPIGLRFTGPNRFDRSANNSDSLSSLGFERCDGDSLPAEQVSTESPSQL